MSGQLYNVAHGPDWADRVLAIIELDDGLRCRLLALQNVWKTLSQFEHVKELYAIEIHDRTPDVVLAKDYDTEAPEDDGATDDWADVQGALHKSEDGGDGEHPRIECMTLLVLRDGVQWQWYAKHCDDLYSTAILTWARIRDDAEECEKCGTPFSQASIDGGRCLGSDQEGRFCGSTIVAVSVSEVE